MLLDTKREVKAYRHGGRTVLTVSAERPLGDTAAAVHLRELINALCQFAEQTHLPAAVSALEQAVAQSAVFGFFPYRYEVKLQNDTHQATPCVTLRTALYHGDTPIHTQRLSTYWTRDLSLQRTPPKTKSE